MTNRKARSRRRPKEFGDDDVKALTLKALEVDADRSAFPDPEQRGLYIRLTANGSKSFVVVTRDSFGKQKWVTIERTDLMSIETARERARDIIARVKAGKPPVEPPKPAPMSYRETAEAWLQRVVIANRHRGRAETERMLRVYVFPHWATRDFASIRRSDVALLLDGIQDNHGARMADLVLSTITAISRWFSTRDDDYTPPTMYAMRRKKAKPRERVLTDDEIRTLWAACEQCGSYGAFAQLLLLSGQRRAKLLDLRWGDVTDDGVWVIRSAPREKSNAGRLRLPELALAVLRRLPRFAVDDRVFPNSRGTGALSPSYTKAMIDKALPATMSPWTFHDLRRTAKTMMRRCGISRDDSEAVLGHVVKGTEGIYDRYDRFDEKRIALERLAAAVAEIINGPIDKVVRLRASGWRDDEAFGDAVARSAGMALAGKRE